MNLQAEMAKLPEPPVAEWPNWDFFRRNLWRDAQTHPPESFATWSIVHHNFLSSWLSIDPAPELVGRDLERYGPAMSHAPFEAGDDYGPYSRNLVKQTGWIAWWEQNTGRTVDALDTIFEFGGGFGATCYIVRKLGFKGRYLLYDYPEMLLLQQWWLEQENIGCEIARPGDKADLFIAMTSLSETTREFRDNHPINADSFLIEWQERYRGTDNDQWFHGLFERMGMTWADLKEQQAGLWVSAAWR